jgi:hypothetical protein
MMATTFLIRIFLNKPEYISWPYNHSCTRSFDVTKSVTEDNLWTPKMSIFYLMNLEKSHTKLDKCEMAN